MRKLRARMADMGTACYVCAWPVLKRRFGVRRASEMNAKAELTVAATVDDIQADA
jgi:hypothetical protein